MGRDDLRGCAVVQHRAAHHADGRESQSHSHNKAEEDPQHNSRTAGLTLRRILRILIICAVALLAVFAVVFYLGQRANSGPTIPDRAVTAAEQAVRDDPNNVNARLGLASAYLASNRKDEALTQYRTILEAEPANRDALLASGKLAYQSKDFATARDLFGRMLKVSGGEEFSAADPQIEEAEYYFGLTELDSGNVPAAIKHLQAALRIDKTDADAWNTLAGAQVKQGDYKSAVASYQQAVRFIPSGWCEPYNGMVVAYTSLKDTAGIDYAQGMASFCDGDSKAGMESLAKVTTGPLAVPAMLGLGLAAESQDDVAVAAGWFKKVLKADPTNITARTALARLGATAAASPSASGGKS